MLQSRKFGSKSDHFKKIKIESASYLQIAKIFKPDGTDLFLNQHKIYDRLVYMICTTGLKSKKIFSQARGLKKVKLLKSTIMEIWA